MRINTFTLTVAACLAVGTAICGAELENQSHSAGTASVRQEDAKPNSDSALNRLPWSTESALYADEPPKESLQFQFQIGDWDITAERFDPRTETLLSTARFEQHVEYRDDKRMIVEETTVYSSASGEKVRYGIALRTYSAATGQWQVTFLGSHQPQPASTYQFEKHNDEMIGYGKFTLSPATTVFFKMRFFNIEPDSYEWEQKYSLDGENWHLERTQSAKRQPAQL